MKKINRAVFLKRSFQLGALTALNPVHSPIIKDSNFIGADSSVKDTNILNRLIIRNDRAVTALLKPRKLSSGRELGYSFSILAASYCYPDSKYYKDPVIVPELEKVTDRLLSLQTEDGTMNFGNLGSPPDTGFLLEPLTAGVFLLNKDSSAPLTKIKEKIKKFILKAGDALAVGGVQTANHRWVVSSALARINELYPDKKYVDRINDWLGEHIYNDEDGHFLERSRNYSVVEDSTIITIGRLLKKESLFEPVRKNLKMTYYYMEPDGDLVVVDSRRQDQYFSSLSIVQYYLSYRYMAIKDNNGEFAAIARKIEKMESFEKKILPRSLFYFLENETLQKKLPRSSSLPQSFEKLFTTSALLRIRRGNTTSTFFGGVDWPVIVASGRSCSPNFFSYRKGNAVLKYMRLSKEFFSTGYFYSKGIKKDADGYHLFEKLEVPYYQPLPKKDRKEDGHYNLSQSVDRRYWNMLSFDERPVSNVKTLLIKIALRESNGKNEIVFDITGEKNVFITIELCFKEGGKLSGMTTGGDEGNCFLENGMGKYEYEGDTIEFGPGTGNRESVPFLSGERYSTHFGSLRTDGMHVYLTGRTPFQHTLIFR